MTLPQASTRTRLSQDTKAQELCHHARQQENVGDYEGARKSLSPYWSRIGERPNLQNLSTETQAEMLWRAGTLSGWIGSANQITGAHAFAKDLIGEAARLFESIGAVDKLAETETDLALCYWREGAMDEARVFFEQALSHAQRQPTTVRVLINYAVIEYQSDDNDRALALLNAATPAVDSLSDNMIQGRYHTQRAIVLKRIGGTENLDLALIENTAASYHFQQAGHTGYHALAENNIGNLLLEFQRYDDAHKHLDNASSAFLRIPDLAKAAQVNETRARIFIAQNKYSDGLKTATAAVNTLLKGDEPSLLAEALTTQGISLARLGENGRALTSFTQASEVATNAGDSTSSIRAKLTTIEELDDFLSPLQLATLYIDTDNLIGPAQDIATIRKLRTCATITIKRLQPTDVTSSANLNFHNRVLQYEKQLINDALDKANGITGAARRLGISHQGLGEMLATRHKDLLRVKPKPRRRSIMKKQT